VTVLKSPAELVREDEPTRRVPTPRDTEIEAPEARPDYLRGAILASIGAIALFIQLASTRQVPRGALLGAFSTTLLAVGLLELLGLVRARVSDVPLVSTILGPRPGESVYTAPMYTVPIAILIAIAGCFAAQGNDTGIAVTLLASLLIGSLSAFHRPGLVPILLLAAIGLPRLGAFALWDPWETHYGEVAREILSRDDWISLWWAQDGWFWSKPILIFWTEAWSMSALGVSALPDAHPGHAEWALRLPAFLMSLGAVVAVQTLTRRVFGPRAGVLAALVVGTMPHFYLLAHQAITDMPLGAALTVSIGLLGFAIVENDGGEPRRIRIGPYGVSSRSVVAFVVLVLVLPQIVYLATRNIAFYPSRFAFAFAGDQFLDGSAGNFGVPGNANVHVTHPVFPHPWPLSQAVAWLAVLAVVLYRIRQANTRRAVAMFGFYIACAIGLLGKGIPGVALPGIVALFYLIASRRWSLLTRGELEVGTGVAIVTLIGLPWYVAMYVRHGRAFIDRILIHDHINRLASGVHGDNGAIDYFLSQLGYATFPFAGLLPVAIVAFVFLGSRSRDRDGDAPGEIDEMREVGVLVSLWALAGFTLFNAMVTKFHHYIFPVVPPAGMLVGIVLDRALPKPADSTLRAPRAVGYATVFGTVALLFGVAGFYGNVRGIVPANATSPHDWVAQHGFPSWATAMLAVIGIAAIVFAIVRSERDSSPMTSLERGLAAAVLGGAVITAFAGRDTSWVSAARPAGPERFIQLFIYMYSRPFPAQFDYRPIFSAFAVVATIGTLLIAVRRAREVGVRVLLVSALLMSAFAVDVYLPDLAEHWSTNGLIDRYYAARRPGEELIAFQMNWKGENFYTGNRVSVYVDLDTSPLRAHFEASRGKTIYALLEHSRIDSLRSLMPAGSSLDKLSTIRDNNKFVLVRLHIARGAGS